MKILSHRPKLFSDVFELVYIAISVATFTHTMFASAITFEGPPPDWSKDPAHTIFWYLSGALVAVAIDVGLFLSAREISRRRSLPMFIAFFVAAVASFYTQTLYAVYHMADIKFASGVTDYWQEALKPGADARVIILPLMLPLFAVVYTLARINSHGQKEEEKPKEVPKPVPAPVPQLTPDDLRIMMRDVLKEMLPASTESEQELLTVEDPELPAIAPTDLLALPARVNDEEFKQRHDVKEDQESLTFLIDGKSYGPYQDLEAYRRKYRAIRRKLMATNGTHKNTGSEE